MSVVTEQVRPCSRLLLVCMASFLLSKSSLGWSLAPHGKVQSFWKAPCIFSGGRTASICSGFATVTSSDSDSPKNKSKTAQSLLTGKKIVSVKDCLLVFGEPGVVFVDGSWFLKDRSGRKEFEAGPRISGARFFDIDDVAAKGELLNPKGLPHMMPPKELFAAAMDAMNIHNQDHLIMYATKGCVSKVQLD
jgi:hypothetical protein